MSHRAHNIIKKLKDSQGMELVTHKDMESTLVQHFSNIAKEPMEDRSRFIDKITQDIPKLFTSKDNHNLNRRVSEEEFSEDILEVVEDSRQHKKALKALNVTFIALIPKKENVITPDGFRPIALCNVVYKIISKVIANRLKPLLPSLITEEQTDYVEGRHILNNIIQAHEVVHSLKSNKQARMIIQLDLLKAYDKLN
eukprot:PITA_09093